MSTAFRSIKRSKTTRPFLNEQNDSLDSPRDVTSRLHLLEIKRIKKKALREQQRRERLRNLMMRKFRLIYNVIRLIHHHEHVILEKHEELLKKREKLLLYPNDFLKRLWDLILFLTYIYTAIYLPLRLAFMSQTSNGATIMDSINDSLFIIEMIVQLRSCYYDRQNTLISNQWKIILNYIKGWFIFDIITLIPFDSIFNYPIPIQKSLRLIRLFRIRLIAQGSAFRSHQYKWESLFNILNTYQKNLIQLILRFAYFQHLFTCLWYIASKNNLNDEQDDEIFGVDVSGYINSLFWTLQTFSTVGYGNDPAYSYFQYIVAIIWMFIGSSFYCFMVIHIYSLLKKVDAESVYLEIQTNLSLFFSKIKVIDEVKKKSQSFFMINIKHNKTWSITLQEWFQNLPLSSQKEISLFVSYKKMLQIHFFKLNLNFSVSILPKMMLVQTQKYRKIWLKGELVNEIFFLLKGKIQYQTQFGTVLLEIEEGQVFGEQEFFNNMEYSKQLFRTNYAIAADISEYIILNEEYFFTQLSQFPALLDYLALIAQKRDCVMKKNWNEFQIQKETEKQNQFKLERIKESCNIQVEQYEGMIKPLQSTIYETSINRTQFILDQIVNNKKVNLEKLMNKFRKVVQMIIFGNRNIEKQSICNKTNTSIAISKIHPINYFQLQQNVQTQTTLKTYQKDSKLQTRNNKQNNNSKRVSIFQRMRQGTSQSFRLRKLQLQRKIWIQQGIHINILPKIFLLVKQKSENDIIINNNEQSIQENLQYFYKFQKIQENLSRLYSLKKQVKNLKKALILQIQDNNQNY